MKMIRQSVQEAEENAAISIKSNEFTLYCVRLSLQFLEPITYL